MTRQIAICLGAVLCVPTLAHAITITAGGHALAPNKAGQTINVMLDSEGEFYTDGYMWSFIAAGGPVITHVFGDTDGPIPAANFAGSVWAGGSAGVAFGIDGTSPGASGRRVEAGFITPGVTPTNVSGIFATLTLDTTGVVPGTYLFSLTAHPHGPTELFNGLTEDFDPVPTDLTLMNGSFTVMPEPASSVLGFFAVAALTAVRFRRRLAWPC
jgi:hypothetical protein